MIGESSRPRLAGIQPAPLCREDDRRTKKMLKMASSLPSLARLGMFRSANDAKSRFIHKHIRAATALAQASPEGHEVGMGVPLPRHWGGPPGIPMAKFSQPLAVMATEAALEDLKRNQRGERKRDQSSRGRRKIDNSARQRQQRSGASTSTASRRARLLEQSQSDGQIRLDNAKHCHDHNSQHHHHINSDRRHPRKHCQQQQQQQNRPPSTHAVILPQGGGLILVGEDTVRLSKFPRGCERVPGAEGASGKRMQAISEQSNAGDGCGEDVLTRLCNPKHFTGTAATGHLPSVVDLEGGVGVLLKGASSEVKDHIGAQEVSWRLRLAERL